MSETATESAETATESSSTEEPKQPKPTETVDFWKQKAREQEKRAKDNADAAKRLAELEDAQKSESERAAERISKAEAEVASVPSKVADALRQHLVELHEIDKDDAELFLTGSEPDLLLKQVKRLLAQSGERRKQGNHVPREGNTSANAGSNDERVAARNLFGGG
jgi:predicted phage tail protein